MKADVTHHDGRAGYTPPPTGRDRAQSIVHHADSTAYNLKHARAHADEALRHAAALRDRLSAVPAYRTHFHRLTESDEAERVPRRAEAGEQRALRRGAGAQSAERQERRLARGGRR